MQILYVLSVLSFLALVWAAFSITRHIRRNAAAQESTEPPVLIHPTRSGTRRSPQAAEPETRSNPHQDAHRDPVSAREHADWVALQKSIGNHDLGNLNYPRAAGGTRQPQPQTSAQTSAKASVKPSA
jgi:hypothetical protein